MSLTIPRSILIAGRKTSVRLENAFWVGLQEIADQRLMTLPGLIATIDAQRHHGNRSSALRLFVLEYYRRQVADAPEASSGISVPNPSPPRASRREGRGSGKIRRTFRREREFGPCFRYTVAYAEPRLSRPVAAPTPADEKGPVAIASTGRALCLRQR